MKDSLAIVPEEENANRRKTDVLLVSRKPLYLPLTVTISLFTKVPSTTETLTSEKILFQIALKYVRWITIQFVELIVRRIPINVLWSTTHVKQETKI